MTKIDLKEVLKNTNKKIRSYKILLNKLLSIYPQIESHIQVMELGTPKTIARYTNNSTSSMYGWTQITSQSGFNRPSFKTPFKNAIIVED